MKRLNDLRKQLPSNAKLNTFESTRVKGGADKKTNRGNRPSGGDGNGDDNGGSGWGG